MCTVKDALLWYCDTSCLARAGLLKTLLQYVTDPTEKDKLQHLCTDQKVRRAGDHHHQQKGPS
jgi:hypothetical protein